MNNQPVDRQSDETRLTGELTSILKRQIGECEKMYQERTRQQILAWHEAEKQKLYILLEELTDDDDCEYDHHNYCQAHSLHDNPCPHSRSKELLNKSKGGKI